MKEIKLRFAIVSDLHCHPEDLNNYKNNATLLFTDKLRNISKEHPVENLKELKINDSIEDVDILLCPGDFTNQSNKQGLISGWDFTFEISEILKAKSVYATLGNHDIDSRNTFTNYSFSFPKGIKKSFPLNDNDIGQFWNKGFTFIERDEYLILVINSTHYHTHDPKDPIDNPNVKGKIDRGEIEEIEKFLKKNNDDKIKIMLCHHHPKVHSRNGLGEHDFIENGEELLDVLGKYKFDFIVHGHKHDPWFGVHNTTSGYKIPILSAGSFSAKEQISHCYKVNYFHIVEIRKAKSTNGTIRTWNYKATDGWSNKMESFLPFTGFGNSENIESLVDKIEKIISLKISKKWSEIVEEIDNLEYLLPEEVEELFTMMEAKEYSFTKNSQNYPDLIYNNRLIREKHGC
ncbi:MAG: metallophosphoesterase [Flavobacterium sp.]|nr:metallophosphoesterase [Flavobacterium sp.]